MKKFIFIFILLIFCDLQAQSSEQDKPYYKNYQRGNVFLKHKDYRNAVIEYKKALLEDPNLPQLYLNTAICYDEGHENLLDLNKAIQYYEKYLAQGGTKVNEVKKFIKNIANLQFKTTEEEYKQLKQAVTSYNEGIKLGKEKEYQQAIKVLQQVLEIVPYYVKAHYSIGIAYFNNEDYMDAYTHLLEVVKLDSDNPELKETYYYLGILHDDILIKDYDLALQFYDQYKNRGGERDIAKFKAAIIKLNEKIDQAGSRMIEGDFDKALDILKDALKLKPYDIRLHNNIGIIYIKKKNYKTAQKYLEDALAVRKNVGSTYYNLACLYSLQNNIGSALDYFKKGMDYFTPQDLENARTDMDLKNLQSNNEFQQLLNK